MSGWQKYTFEDVCRKIYSGGTPSTKHAEYWNGTINWLSSGETGNRFIYDTERKITELGVKKSATKKAYKGNTVVASAGQGYTRGQASYLTIDTYVNQSVIVFDANTDIIDSKFLFYNLSSRYEELRQLSDGTSTRGGLSGWIVKRMEIYLPPLAVQKQIVTILSAIDDKIELNTAINQNLENQAQAIFKSWFVDFEPFGGIIPDDWRKITLEAIATISTKSVNPTKNPDLYLEHYSIPAFDEQHYPVFEYAREIKSNKYTLTDNSVMISKLNPDTKRIWRPLCLSENPVCSTEFIVYEAVNPKHKDYLYSLIDSQAFSDYLCAHTTGSTNSRQRATPKTTLDFPCLLPTDEIIARFCGIITPMYEQIAAGIIENQRLSDLRDTLLPKLMNGEIDVSAVKV